MRKGFYARLAAVNIIKNSKTYLPFIITCIITTAMTYIIRSLGLNPGISLMRGGSALREILGLGSHITLIFAFIFLFYTNSFLVKRRKKEFGLFNILGMEKRHIARILLLESVYILVISLVLGFALGIMLDKLMFLVLTKMLGADIQLGFYISVDSIATSSVFMLITFLMIHLNSLRQIHFSNPIKLLYGSDMGEKEPKAKWLMALLGVLSVGAGYYISIVTKEPLQAMALFFIAVLLVIVGTYLLFTAGSIAFLKILKKNKKYYYKINHFTSVSGMMYRMKQNAVGLSSICILSTMVLVMISTTSCLLAGVNDIIKIQYPYDFEVFSSDDSVYDVVDEYLSTSGADVKGTKKYTSLVFAAIRDGDAFYISDDYDYSKTIYRLGVIDLADYNRMTGRDVRLSEDSVLFWTDDKNMKFDEFSIMGEKYIAAERLEDFPINVTDVINKSVCIVVNDRAELQKLYETQAKIYAGNASDIMNYYHFDIETDNEDLFLENLHYRLGDMASDYGARSKKVAYEDCMGIYGGLFFLGAFLGTLFTIQTVLIIYYKQISEGLDDKRRFEIMQNVGMSRHEIKKSIHSQIITVFFLPLVTAGIHTAFSFPLICRILVMFQMTNTTLFALCLLLCFAAFALFYAVIYGVTAKTYYNIVSKK